MLAIGTQVRGFKPGRSRRIFKGEIIGRFLPTKFHLSLLGSLASCGRGGAWRRKLKRPNLGGVYSGLQNKPAGCDASEAYVSGPGNEEE
jgi:hypothetical protein